MLSFVCFHNIDVSSCLLELMTFVRVRERIDVNKGGEMEGVGFLKL